ncbi:hypothetical protein A8B84_14640 [Marinobacter sp. EhC06]|uniref:phage integrase n=1 Tax=Marinobacter TaxID=2742 RepID=UPI0007D9A714|nr:hypothetical protein A8B84_14640 [Marinobacter sp. EhC06]OAN90852.1 hypothetical protein A8B80_19815 [Marinobacter sp. EhN04]
MDSGISENTQNHEQAYLTAVFNELIRQGHWKGKNPLEKLRRLKIDEPELPFQSCFSAFRSALERGGIKLTKGQLTHICRHTLASHFVMNGGHILTLQKGLGHSDLKLTMRYAHLAPDYLNEVAEKGSLA